MFEPFIEKAFQAIKNAKLAPVLLEQVNTLEQHLAFISEKLTNSEKDLAKAEAKVEEQAQEIQFLQAQIATFDGKAKSIDIGPCLVKETVSGQRLEGVYRPHCLSVLEKGDIHYGSVHYFCRKCNFEAPVDAVESALEHFSK